MRPGRFIKQFLPRGLFGRSLIIIVAPMVLLQVVVTYVFLERHWQLVTERLSAKTVAEIAMLLDEFSENPTPFHAARISKRAGDHLGLPTAFLCQSHCGLRHSICLSTRFSPSRMRGCAKYTPIGSASARAGLFRRAWM